MGKVGTMSEAAELATTLEILARQVEKAGEMEGENIGGIEGEGFVGGARFAAEYIRDTAQELREKITSR
jgi:hypothetical protein